MRLFRGGARPRPSLSSLLWDRGPERKSPVPISYSTRCNDDTAPECTLFPPRRPATRARARGSASRRSTSNLLARALERRSAPLRCRLDPRMGGCAGRALDSAVSTVACQPFCGPGSGVLQHLRGHFLIRHTYSTYILHIYNPLMVHFGKRS